MIRVFRNIIATTFILSLLYLIVALATRQYSDALFIFLLFLGTVAIVVLMTIYIEKTAYKVNQKQYMVVMVSEKPVPAALDTGALHPYMVVMVSEKLDHWQDMEVRPFEKEEDAFWAMGKISSTFAYIPAKWNEKKVSFPSPRIQLL